MPVRSGRSTKSSSARNTGPPGSQPKAALTRRQPGSTTGKPQIPQVSGLAGPFGCSAHGRRPECARWLRKTCDYSMGLAGMVAKRGQIEELNSPERTKGEWGCMTFYGSPASPTRTAALGPLSLIRAVGLPQMCTGCSAQRLYSYRSRSCRGQMWRDTCA